MKRTRTKVKVKMAKKRCKHCAACLKCEVCGKCQVCNCLVKDMAAARPWLEQVKKESWYYPPLLLPLPSLPQSSPTYPSPWTIITC